jgi:methyl-accepting chemotaxis protein
MVEEVIGAMEPDSRSGRALSAQLAMLTVIAVLAPAAAVLGLGYWAYTEVGQGSPTPGPQGLDPTVLLSVTVGVAVVAVVLVAVPVLRMRAAVRNRVLELAEVCRQVSQGQRNARARVRGEDEFSILAASVNALLDGTPLPGARRTEGADATALQSQIEKLLQEVSAVGDGDLRVQAEVTPDTLGVLADSFNYMIEELGKVVGRVQATALQVTNATRRLLDRSAEVAGASEAQALQINQTSDAVARLADFVQLSANNALSAAEAARDALRNAQSGRQAVVQTIEGMDHIRVNVQDTSKKIKRLSERAQEVGEIVRLIEDIADQTNLLALNAAIQSAMAGENGRGFAVVADEIRALAERVSEATKKVTTLVKSIQGDTFEAVVAMEESTQEVVSGSKLADDAGRSLQSIYGSVERQVQIVEGIASAASERKQIAEAVAHSMGRIAEIARQTNAATQDATISVSYLAELAEQLRASVATFRLPQQLAESVGIPPEPEAAYAPTMALPGTAAPAWSGGMNAGMPGDMAGPITGPMTPGAMSRGGSLSNLPALPGMADGADSGMGGPGTGGFDAGYGGPVGPGYQQGYQQGFDPGYSQGGFDQGYAPGSGYEQSMAPSPYDPLAYPAGMEQGDPLGALMREPNQRGY